MSKEPVSEDEVPSPRDPGAVCDAIQAVLDNPNLSDNEVLRRIQRLLRDAREEGHG